MFKSTFLTAQGIRFQGIGHKYLFKLKKQWSLIAYYVQSDIYY